jgi:peptide deformylase
VKALDRNGKPIQGEYTGYIARIFQHEIDHLDGTLFYTKASKLHKVRKDQFGEYRNQEKWRDWPHTCTPEELQQILKVLPKKP